MRSLYRKEVIRSVFPCVRNDKVRERRRKRVACVRGSCCEEPYFKPLSLIALSIRAKSGGEGERGIGEGGREEGEGEGREGERGREGSGKEGERRERERGERGRERGEEKERERGEDEERDRGRGGEG